MSSVKESVGRGVAAGSGDRRRLVEGDALFGCPLLPSVRADLLRHLDWLPEARGESERVASLAGNDRERRLPSERATEPA